MQMSAMSLSNAIGFVRAPSKIDQYKQQQALPKPAPTNIILPSEYAVLPPPIVTADPPKPKTIEEKIVSSLSDAALFAAQFISKMDEHEIKRQLKKLQEIYNNGFIQQEEYQQRKLA